jgi:hypothetical protein
LFTFCPVAYGVVSERAWQWKSVAERVRRVSRNITSSLTSSSRPVPADQAERAMLDHVPLRGPGG